MLTPTRRQFLTAVGASALCGTLSASVSAEEGQAPAVGMTVCQLKNQTRTQMMGYIIRTATGELIVVDGGNAGDASHVLEMLEQLNGGPNPKVTAWFLTHAHSDHYGALCELIRTERLPEVKEFWFNFPSTEWVLGGEPGCKPYIFTFDEQIVKVQDRCFKTQKDQKFTFGNVTVTVLNDPFLDQKRNPVNNSSVCFRFETASTSLIFLGDLGKEGSLDLLNTQKPELLKADAVQMAHHGQQGSDRSLYVAIAPKTAFWPTPDWLWVNDCGRGPDSGPWKIHYEQRWAIELEITKNYIAKDGTRCVEFP